MDSQHKPGSADPEKELYVSRNEQHSWGVPQGTGCLVLVQLKPKGKNLAVRQIPDSECV